MSLGDDATPAGRKDQSKAKIFISYSRRDTDFADRLERGLKTHGFDTLIDRSEIYALEDWWKRIEALIAQADTIVFALSPDAVASEVCQREVQFAASLNKRLAPVVCRRVEDAAVPEALARLNFIFFDDAARFDDSLERLCEALETDIDWVRKHTEFGELARRWVTAGRPGPRGILLRSPALEEAERWIASRPEGAPAPIEAAQAFIAASRRASTRRRNILSASLGSGLVLALGLAGLAYWQRGMAVEQRDRALSNQSLFLADLARQQGTNNDAGLAVLLAAEGLPDSEAAISRPVVAEAELQLDEAWRALREQLVLQSGEDSVDSASFSPDGKRILTASGNFAWLWDAQTGRQIGAPFTGHDYAVYGAAFSPDGKRVVTAGYDMTARLWDVDTGKQIGAPLTGHEDHVFSAAFSPDGRRIVTASGDKTARLWDVETGKEIGAPLTGHTDRVSTAVFSPDGARILTASYDKTVRLWDAKTGRQIGAPLTGHTDGVNSAAFSPDGKRIATASQDMTARLWDAQTGAPIGQPLSGHAKAVMSAVFSPDGKSVVTASEDKTVRLWDAQTGAPIGTPFTGHEAFVTSASFSPDGKRIVTASWDKTARVWTVEPDAQAAAPLTIHERYVKQASFSPDGKRIVTASFGDFARLWDAESGKLVGSTLISPGAVAGGAVFSPDGKRIVTPAVNKTARLWDAETGAPIGFPLTGHTGDINSAAFGPDGKRVVTASADMTAQLWDGETGRVIGGPLIGHTGAVMTAAFSPDGRRIVTASRDKTARLWDAETGRQIGAPLAGTAGFMTSASFSPNGKRIVTTSMATINALSETFFASSVSDKTVQLWDAETGKPVGSLLTDPTVYVLSASFSADGRRIVTASNDKTARLWDAQTGKQIGAPMDHDAPVSSAVFSPDGKRVLTASNDDVRVWPVFATTQELVSYAKALVPRCLTHGQRLAAFLDPEPPAWCIEREKWPYQTQDWKDWLKFTRANAKPPLPGTPEWKDWVSAHAGK